MSVAILLAIHFVLITMIVVIFARNTQFTMLGNSWMAISQAVTANTKQYFETSLLKTDKQIKEEIKQDGYATARVGLAQIEGLARVGIVMMAKQDTSLS